MLLSNTSLKTLHSLNSNSTNTIRCFGSDVGNIIRVETHLNILKSTSTTKQNINSSFPQQPTQCSLSKQPLPVPVVVPPPSTLSPFQQYYKPTILTNLLKNQPAYPTTAYPPSHKTLINSLILLHQKLSLSPQTLYLSATLFNLTLPHTLSDSSISPELLSLVCLWIASKIQETKVPSVRFWATLLDSQFQQHQIILAEQQILTILDYCTVIPTCVSFLNLIMLMLEVEGSSREGLFVRYVLEVGLYYPDMVGRYGEAGVAMGAVYLGWKVLGRGWEEEERRLSGIVEGNQGRGVIRECAKELCVAFQKDIRGKNSAVYRKYREEKYGGVAGIRVGRRSEMME